MGRGEQHATTTLIEESHRILEEQQPITVRRVVYELFNQKFIPSTAKSEENKVSRLLTKARKDGRIPWEWIVDDHRRPERTLTFRDRDQALRLVKERYRKDYWPTQPVHVAVWSEKSTVAGILRPVLVEYQVEFVAVHGNNSTTRVHEASEAQLRDGRPWVVIHTGDWDPSGCRMSEDDLPRRVKEDGANIEIKRVALLPGDVAALQPFKFDVDDKRRAAEQKYRDQVGKRGIDSNKPWFVARYGRDCMELDAMNSNDLRARVEAAIQAYIDWPAWEHMQLIEKAGMDSINDILGRYSGGTSAIVRCLRIAGHGAEHDQVPAGGLTMPDPVVDLNTFVGSGEVQHIEFGDPHSFLELKILGPVEAVTFISVHVPVGLLRTLYTLDRDTKVLARGELAFVKGDRQQHCIKAVLIARVDPNGRGTGALVGYRRWHAAGSLLARPPIAVAATANGRLGAVKGCHAITPMIGVTPRSSAGVRGSNVTPLITMQGKEMDCMAIDVEVIYPPDDPGELSRSWTWQAPGPTVIDALHQTWREFNMV